MANDRDILDRIAELAETLRAAIDSLDERIEERARELAAQRGPLSRSELISDVMARMSLIGESIRHGMIERMSDDPQARDFLARIPASHWTSSAANLVAGLCHHEAGHDEVRKDGPRG